MRVPRAGSVLTIASTLLLTALTGCMSPTDNDGNDGSSDDGEGSVAFYVKDAPADDFVSVFVTFTEVKVHRAGDGSDDDDLSSVPDDDLSTVPDDTLTTVPDDTLTSVPDDDVDDASGAGWFTIVDTEHTIDLKQFQGDARAFLGDATVDAGKYTQIRIMVSDVYGEDATGARTNFTLPSDTLKIVRPWTVGDGEETVLTVDFDLEQSIQQTGNGQYRMKPVLKLTVENGAPDATDSTDASDEATDAPGGGKPTDKGKPSNNTHKP